MSRIAIQSNRCGPVERLEDEILAEYAARNGSPYCSHGRTPLGMTTGGGQLNIGANGHLRVGKASSVRCIREDKDGSPMMCATMDSNGEMVGWSSVFEMYELNDRMMQ